MWDPLVELSVAPGDSPWPLDYFIMIQEIDGLRSAWRWRFCLIISDRPTPSPSPTLTDPHTIYGKSRASSDHLEQPTHESQENQGEVRALDVQGGATHGDVLVVSAVGRNCRWKREDAL
ncbi:hypothetical protein RRG08_016114 [Elysia crispata]|uniref:Uncharacterized protein n=1 Tax=Elysia crispata TaxID=231223 RepID=A0AAE0ZNF8_9GAST|nr:hypothetical protein RRG08_016114 [Elysia crispata]